MSVSRGTNPHFRNPRSAAFHVKQFPSLPGFGHIAKSAAPVSRRSLQDLCPGESAPKIDQWRVQLEGYAGLLYRWSQRLSLISSGDRAIIPEKHIFPSLALRQIIMSVPNRVVWDLGSGAGLPGIPLAITLPETSFLLIESRRRKASFLREVIRRLSLGNAFVLHERLEPDSEGLPGGSPKADVVLSRAAFGPDQMRSRLKGRTQHRAFLITTLPPSSSAPVGRPALIHRWRGSGLVGSALLQQINPSGHGGMEGVLNHQRVISPLKKRWCQEK